MADNFEPEMIREDEEPVESKIAGKQAMIDQMNRMIAENHRMIGLGDDVVARQKMITHLTNEIANNEREIAELRKQL